jgi:hypothetical protein
VYITKNSLKKQNKMEPNTNMFRVLQQTIGQLSTTTQWSQAKTEWDLIREWWSDEIGHCMCGHAIRWRNVMVNKINGNECIVGSECVHRFDEPALTSQLNHILETRRQRIIGQQFQDDIREISMDIALRDRDGYELTFKVTDIYQNKYIISPTKNRKKIFAAVQRIVDVCEDSRPEGAILYTPIGRKGDALRLKVTRPQHINLVGKGPFTMKIHASKPWTTQKRHGFSLHFEKQIN